MRWGAGEEGEGEKGRERGRERMRWGEGGRERRGETERQETEMGVGGRERGWEGRKRETHRKRQETDTEKEKGREETCLPGGHRGKVQFAIQAGSTDVMSRTWAGCMKEMHILPMFMA